MLIDVQGFVCQMSKTYNFFVKITHKLFTTPIIKESANVDSHVEPCDCYF